MAEAGEGDKVKVHYTGTLEDGSVFDSSREREPLEFSMGKGQLIPGFEAAVAGMKEGEKQTVVIEPEDAYGQRNDDMIICIDRKEFPPEIEVAEGMRIPLQSPEGQSVVGIITAFDDDSVTLDVNHPLAGKQLTFEIELIEIIAD